VHFVGLFFVFIIENARSKKQKTLQVSADYVPIINRKTVFMRHLIFVILYGWLYVMQDGMHTTRSSTQNNRYQVSHKQIIFSWWWAHSLPKYFSKALEYNLVDKANFVHNFS